MQTKTKARKRDPVPTAGYRLGNWAEAAGFSRQKYYALDNPPRRVKINHMRIIAKSPTDWLALTGGAQ